MADYVRFGTAQSLFDAGYGRAFGPNLAYCTATECEVVNADGSITNFTGVGLSWDDSLGRFASGTITAVTHYSDGSFNDSLGGLSIDALTLEQAFERAGSADALRIYMFSGNDTLDASARLDDAVVWARLIGYNGNDTITGGAGGDLLGGESGNDTIYGNGGDDRIYGGSGNDKMYGGDGIDRFLGDSGDDLMNGGAGDDIMYGSAGNDTYVGDSGTDTAVYTRSLYDLVITKTANGFTVIEPHGTDTLTSIEHIATDEGIFVRSPSTGAWVKIDSTPGDLLLNPGEDYRGTEGDDTINLAGTGKTIAIAGGGNDSVTGTAGYELLIGGGGNDKIYGDPTADTGKNYRLYGEAGNDFLRGMACDDMLYGGIGSDTLVGGPGDDELTGGNGADRFVFSWNANAQGLRDWGDDTIRDFVVGTDHVHFNFSNVSPGSEPTPTLTQTADGALISLDGGGTIFLVGVDATGHTIDDFLI